MSFFKSKKSSNPEPTITDPQEPSTAEEVTVPVEQPIEHPEPELAEEEKLTDTSLQTLTHLAKYPLVKETIEFVDNIPGVKATKQETASIINPALKYATSQPFIKSSINLVDKFSEQTLESFDKTVPCVKTTTYADIATTVQSPFIKTDRAIKKVATSIGETVEESIIDPSIKLVHDTRSYYNQHIYDTKGKPLLRSSLDPVFKPVNAAIEDFAQKNFAEAEPVSKNFSSEIERNLVLSFNVIERSIPVVGNKVGEVAMLPCNYVSHALDVFNDNLSKQEGKGFNSTVAATYNSSLDLVSEAWTTTVDIVQKTIGLKKTQEEQNSEPNHESAPAQEPNATTNVAKASEQN